MNMAKEKEEANVGRATGTSVPKVRWDDSGMSTSYANVVNASSTREEVTLLFGTNQAWHTAQKELIVKLSDRVILSPYAAKRLSVLLSNVVNQYEQRFGKLNIEGGAGETAP
jgi:hypothetical protein